MNIENDNPLDGTDNTYDEDSIAAAFEDVFSGKSDKLNQSKATDDNNTDDDDELDTVDTDGEDESDATEDDSSDDNDDDGSADDDDTDLDEDNNISEEKLKQKEVTVKIGDKTEKVKVEELAKGYLRHQDYSKKTSELSEERKALKIERENYAKILPQLEALFSQNIASHEEMEQLRINDPVSWTIKREEQRLIEDRLYEAQYERQRLDAIKQSEYKANLEAHLASEEAKMLEAMPRWKDTNKKKADFSRLVEYGEKVGFSKDELTNATDHRALIGLYKAMKYDEMVAKSKQSPDKRNAPVVTSKQASKGMPSTKTTAKNKAISHLRTLSSTEDIADAFGTIFNSK